MVFQNYALFPHMTVAENLSFPLEVRKIPKTEREAKVKQVLELVQMGEFGGRRPRAIVPVASSSVSPLRVRWCLRAELVLMDEPLGALDKQVTRNDAVRNKAHCG